MENIPVQPPVQNVTPVTPPVVNQVVSPVTPPPASEPKHKIPTWLKILAPGVVIILAIALSAGAFVLSKNQASKTTEVATPTIAPTATPTPTPNPTASWKTYVNTEGDYSIKYPSDFTLHVNEAHVFETNTYKPTANHLELDSDKSGVIPYITISFSGSSSATFQDFINQQVGSDQSPSYKTTTIDVYDNIPSAAGTQTAAFSQHNNKFYVITIENTADKTFPNMFLSTFKFTDISPAPTCRPRPACLDTTPRCMIAETPDMCPPTITPSQ